MQAAEVLGCDYSHLRRVIIGERQSKTLVAKFHTLATQPQNATAQKRVAPIDLAAAENLSPFFFKTLATLGLEVVIVRFDAKPDSPIWGHPGIERELERELQVIQAGMLDSSWFTEGAQWHFFHVATSQLGKAMQQIKSGLDARGLLPVTTLLHAESASALREWYPGTTAALIQADAETGA
ncbi:MAG TPA: hypothetical protein DCQ92_12480 [Verrucomicrobia subdivision 3 bacterium]|nr:hypothetical protein [Limisphaerales bacterium]